MILPRLRYKEKEFGVLQDIRHSGIGRTYKKWVGRGRKALAGKLQAMGDKLADSVTEVLSPEILGHKGINNPELLKQLMEDAKSRGAITLSSKRVGTIGNMVSPVEDFKPAIDKINETIRNNASNPVPKKQINIPQSTVRTVKRLQNAQGDNKYVILLDTNVRGINPTTGKYGILGKSANADAYSHEVGHIMNRQAAETNPIQRFINRLSGDLETRKRLNVPKSYTPASTLKDTVKRTIYNTGVVVEEAQASKNGINLMRKYGASPEELQAAREYFNTTGESYKRQRKIDLFRSLGNTIQIPSRRI